MLSCERERTPCNNNLPWATIGKRYQGGSRRVLDTAGRQRGLFLELSDSAVVCCYLLLFVAVR